MGITTGCSDIGRYRLAAFVLAVVAAFSTSTFAQTPPNDDCVDRTAITDGVTPFDLAGATADPAAPTWSCGLNPNDIWFNYVATCDGELQVDTLGTGADTVLEGWRGTGCPPSVFVNCNDDGGGFPPGESILIFNVNAGEAIKIRLGGWNNGQFTGVLNVNCTPDPVGACCLTDGTCADLTAYRCGQLGGAYQGDDTECADDPCTDPPGACCLPGNSCTIATADDCLASGGTYQGEFIPCAPNPCLPATGACCMTGGVCETASVEDCASLGGTYSGDGILCLPNPCPDGFARLQLDGPACAVPGGEIDVSLSMLDLGGFPAVGFQAFLGFDTTRLTLTGATYTGAPFPTILIPVDGAFIANANASGTMNVAAGLDFEGNPTSADATLVVFTFQAAGGDVCGTTAGVYFRDHLPPSRVTNNAGDEAPILLVDGPQMSVDSTAPILLVPADLTLNCDADTSPAATGEATAVDLCDGPVVVGSSDTVIVAGCPGAYIIERVWSAADGCGNQASGLQTIVVTDLDPPVISGVPPDATAACDAVPPGPPAILASDVCDGSIIFAPLVDETILPGACAGAGTLVRTWAVTDACGNSASVSQSITLLDTSPPVITGAPADATLACDAVPAADATLPATDSCDATVSTATFDGETVTAGACLGETTIVRTWSVADDCSNIATATQTITTFDTTPPVIADAPADLTIACGESVPDSPASLAASDTCDPTVTTTTPFVEDASNPFVTIRTWTTIDDCGNEATAVQTIVEDCAGACCFPDESCLVATGVDCFTLGGLFQGAGTGCTPNPCGIPIGACCFIDACVIDTVFNCMDAGGVFLGNATNCTPNQCLAGTTRLQLDSPTCVPPGGELKVTLSMLDLNGFTAVGFQAFLEFDPARLTLVSAAYTPQPFDVVILPIDAAFLLNANDTGTMDVAAGLDFQDSRVIEDAELVSFVFDVKADEVCGGPPAIRFRANDPPSRITNDLGEAAIAALVDAPALSIDGTPPVLTLPADLTLACGADIEPTATGVAGAADDCDLAAGIMHTDVVIDLGCPQSFRVERTWTATDDCGNTASGVQTIDVLDDDAPVITGVPADLTLGCDDEVPAAPSTLPASDVCDDTVTETTGFEETTPSGSQIVRTWTVADACGNTASASQTITLPAECPAACCFADGSCQLELPSDCTTAGGVPQGDGSVCDPNPCPLPTGACCVDTACTVETADDCAGLGGVFQGIDVPCDPTPCPLPTGACCVDTSCTVETADDCAGLGGVFQGIDVVCDPTPCPLPTGACCVDTACTVETADDCAGLGGVFQGIDIPCDPTPCPLPTGACCVDTACTVETADDCAGLGGVFQGIDVPCDPTPCPLPTGACCVDTACTIETADDCAGLGGVFQGIDVACEASTCLPPSGACCLDSACTIETADDCAAAGGFYQGDDSACQPSPCIGDVGACCLPDFFCATYNVAECGAAGGVHQGAGTVCNPNPCADGETRLQLDTDVCGRPGSTIKMTLFMGDLNGFEAVGFQAFLAFDTSRLTMIDGAYTDEPFPTHIIPITPGYVALANATGEFDLAAGIDFLKGSPTTEDALLVSMTFEVKGSEECNGPSAIWFRPNMRPNRISNFEAEVADAVFVNGPAFSIDGTAPLLARPVDLALPCGADTDPSATGVATAFDECSNPVTVIFSDETISGACPQTFTIARTWTATDGCGNSVSSIQLIAVEDTSPPVITDVPADIDVECGQPLPPPPDALPASDDCDASVVETTAYGETVQPGGGCPAVLRVIRTWSVADACGQTTTATQVITLVDTVPPVLTIPDDVTSVADAGGCEAILDVGLATANDACAPAADTIVTFVRSDGETDLAAPYAAADSPITITWTATDACDNATSADQTIVVTPVNEVLVDVALQQVFEPVLTRCLQFQFVDCNGGIVEQLEQDVEFLGGSAFGILLTVPCGDYQCIRVRDPLHTLWSTVPTSISLGQYTASATGADWLIGGNLNGDDAIDVLDFGTFIMQFNTVAGPSDCAASGPHADISGDGFVFTEDFTFIQTNFFEFDDPTCCGASPTAPPMMAIRTSELWATGRGHLTPADLNGDGILDLQDVAAFMNGVMPTHRVGLIRRDVQDAAWKDPAAWTMGLAPDAMTTVVLDHGTVQIVQTDAVAASVDIDAGAWLIMRRGATLETLDLVVRAGGTLIVEDARTLLRVRTLYVEAGGTLIVDDARVEITSGPAMFEDGAHVRWDEEGTATRKP